MSIAACLYGWVASLGTELKSTNRPDSWERASHSLWGGECCIHALRESTWGQSQPERENRVLVRCASNANLRKRCDAVLSECESTRPLNPRTQTSPRGEFAPGSVSASASWTDACKALCWWVWDLESGGAPRLFWGPRNSGCKPALQLALRDFLYSTFPSRLHTSCLRTSAFWGNVRDCTTPLKRGGLRLNWRVYPRFITPSSQREIPE